MKGWLDRLPAVRRRARRSRLAVPVLTLVSGTVIAQGLTYAARPFLTRLFTPEDFGFLTLYLAMVGVLSSAATGGYENAAMLPESDEDAWSLIKLALGLTFFVALITLVLMPFKNEIAGLLGHQEIAPFLILVPVGVISYCSIRILEVWAARRSRFRTMSGARITLAAVSAPTQLAAGVAALGPLGLIVGQVAGAMGGAAVLGWSGLRGRIAGVPGKISTLARRYYRFPLFSMPSGFLNTLSLQLPAFVLLSMFSVEAAGFFGVAFSSLAAPMQVVGASVARVFFVRAAEARREGSLRYLTESVAKRLALFGTFPLAAMMVVGPAAFAVVFGEEWREAGVFAQILAPWMLLNFVTSPLSSLYDVMERQPTEFGMNALQSALRLGGLVIGGIQGGPIGALIGFSAVSGLSSLGQSMILFRWAGVSWSTMFALWLRPLLLSSVPVVLLVFLVLNGTGDLVQLIAAAVLGPIYLAAAYRLGGRPS